MSPLEPLARRFRNLTRRSALWREMDEEMRHHVELEARDLEARGVPPVEARRRAIAAFGGVERYREAGWDARGTRWLEDLGRDLAYAFRSLRRAPGFTLMAVTCMALGIGVTTTIFAVVHGVLLRPLPFPDSDRLVVVYAANPERDLWEVNISRPDYLEWRDRNRSFERLGMWTWSTITFSGGTQGDGEAERVDAADVSPELFPLLGVRPQLGRGFLPGEDVPGRDRVLLLSHALWQRRFGGDPSIVGRTITADSLPYTVVGVMPQGFQFPEEGLAWRPLAGDALLDDHGSRFYASAIGRLRPGSTFEQAKADMAAISRALEREFPEGNTGWEAQLVPLREELVGDLRRPLLVMLGAVACVLLIACANVANLLLARGTARRRELAIRTAIGAGRGRVVRQLLTESLAIASLGGVLGGLLAVLGVQLASHVFPGGLPFFVTLRVDAVVLGFVVLVSAASGALFGSLPALRASDFDPAPTLRESAAGAGESRARHRARAALVVAEVALSLVLMTGAGLLIRSYRALDRTELGFDQRGILSMRVTLPSAEYGDEARRATFYEELLARLARLPGVEAVGSAEGVPFSGWDVQYGITVEGRAPAPTGQEPDAHAQQVTPGFFRAIGARILRGRGFTMADRAPDSPVVVVNESFARRFFPAGDALGRRVKTGSFDGPDPWGTIVGVVSDWRHYRLPQPMGPAMYYAYFQAPGPTQTLVLRSRLEDPSTLMPAVRDVLRQLDPDVPPYSVATFEQMMARTVSQQRLQGRTLGAFAALALLLAAVGLYGVIAYSVTQRAREIGLRVALGASRSEVVRVVVAQGARLVLVGIVLGLAVALPASRALAALLYEVRATDPTTFLGVPALLAAVALLASAVPAFAAARVDPQVALRAE